MLIITAILLLAVALLILWSRHRKRKRHEAEVEAAKRVDPTDPNALGRGAGSTLSTSCPARSSVDVDNAVRTSSNELDLAVEEFGPKDTEPFARPSRTPGSPSSRRSTCASSSTTTSPKPRPSAGTC